MACSPAAATRGTAGVSPSGLSAAGRRLDVEASGTIESEMKGILAMLPRQETLAARRVLMTLAEQLQTTPAFARSPRTPAR